MDGNLFQRMTTSLAQFIGRPWMMGLCLGLAILGVAAYRTGDSTFIDETNLAINVLTLMLLPVLQATQNRDGAALQAKLDELINASERARKDLIGLEHRGEQEIEEIRAQWVTEPSPGKS